MGINWMGLTKSVRLFKRRKFSSAGGKGVIQRFEAWGEFDVQLLALKMEGATHRAMLAVFRS